MLPAQPAQASSLRPFWAQTERWHGGRWCGCGVWSPPLGEAFAEQKTQAEAAVWDQGSASGGEQSWEWGRRYALPDPPQSSHSLHLSFGWIKMGGGEEAFSPLPGLNGAGR